ncbi:MAG: fumarylacetoacetate hydrolase family protein [Deltaproteobacteria bacterium]|nr:fumarylacetoacetate hydrolase family protein [Deltaproteobacteria bacterium]
MAIRLANAKGRAVLVLGDTIADVERASNNKFSSDPMAVLAHWDAFASWAAGVNPGAATGAYDEAVLDAPVPRPGKVFAIGLNYKSHAEEAGLPLPTKPLVFTKFQNCICGPRADVRMMGSAYVDWEVELVAVIGRRGKGISEAKALEYVAGYTVGQDISDRKLQFSDTPPQFSMGKSLDTFGPLGPALVSLDAFKDPNDLALTCHVDATQMQSARSSDMVFGVQPLIAYLSGLCTLEPGDIIFTGTPSGVGSGQNPRRYLKPGETIISTIEGIGTITNKCIA